MYQLDTICYTSKTIRDIDVIEGILPVKNLIPGQKKKKKIKPYNKANNTLFVRFEI